MRRLEPEDPKFGPLVSACLLGRSCRYDGKHKRDDAVLAAVGASAEGFCPEEAAGLGTPRPRAHLEGGDGEAVWLGRARVVDENGRDVTEAFKRGAVLALARALSKGRRHAVLKDGSPSCGGSLVDIEGTKQTGVGITAALFLRAGISVEPR